MNTGFDRTTAGFCTKIIDFIPRELTRKRMKHMETSGELRRFLGILSDEEMFQGVLGAKRGTHEITPVKHVLDLSIPCELPLDGVERLVSSVKDKILSLELRDDNLYLGGEKIEFFLHKKQRKGIIKGEELREELEKQGGNVPAGLIDYLEEHSELWPEKWKRDKNENTLCVFFWGDIFRDPSDGRLYVRDAYWNGRRVVSGCYWLEDIWRAKDPAAVLAS